jgi:DNA polymerase-1
MLCFNISQLLCLYKKSRINSKEWTLAIMGFMNSLMDVIKERTGSFSGRFFDNGGSQLRNEIFPEYKAHRDATPEAIKLLFLIYKHY